MSCFYRDIEDWFSSLKISYVRVETTFYIQEANLAIFLVPLDEVHEKFLKDRQNSSDSLVMNPSLLSFDSNEYANKIYLYEDRWYNAPGLCKAHILSRIGKVKNIFARDCIARPLSSEEANRFLDAHHDYGRAKARYRYGLFLKKSPDTLVAVATFSSPRKMNHRNVPVEHFDSPSGNAACVVPSSGRRESFSLKMAQLQALGSTLPELLQSLEMHKRSLSADPAADQQPSGSQQIPPQSPILSYEWVRYASAADARVIGGMGKLMMTFVNDVHPDEIMSYSDSEWSQGEAYRKLGFTQTETRPPVKFVVFKDTMERVALARLRRTVPDVDALLQQRDHVFIKNLGSRKWVKGF